jgi:hypothetical protein
MDGQNQTVELTPRACTEAHLRRSESLERGTNRARRARVTECAAAIQRASECEST